MCGIQGGIGTGDSALYVGYEAESEEDIPRDVGYVAELGSTIPQHVRRWWITRSAGERRRATTDTLRIDRGLLRFFYSLWSPSGCSDAGEVACCSCFFAFRFASNRDLTLFSDMPRMRKMVRTRSLDFCTMTARPLWPPGRSCADSSRASVIRCTFSRSVNNELPIRVLLETARGFRTEYLVRRVRLYCRASVLLSPRIHLERRKRQRRPCTCRVPHVRCHSMRLRNRSTASGLFGHQAGTSTLQVDARPIRQLRQQSCVSTPVCHDKSKLNDSDSVVCGCVDSVVLEKGLQPLPFR